MNRKLPTLHHLKRNSLVLLLLLVGLSSLLGQSDTICSNARSINEFRTTLFSDSARWHVFSPPNAGIIEISTCTFGFTEYHVFDECVDDTARVAIDSLSISPCSNGVIETYSASANDSIYFEVLDGEGINNNRVTFEFIPLNICSADGPIPLLCNVPLDTTTVNGVSDFNTIYYKDCIGDVLPPLEYDGADHIFEVEVLASENIFFKLSNLNNNLDFFLFDNLCNRNSIDCIAANTTDSGSEKIIGPLTLETGTYHIVVDSRTSDIESSFTIEVMCPECVYSEPDFTVGQPLFCNSATFDSTFLNNNAFEASDYSTCYLGPKNFEGQDNLYFVDVPMNSDFMSFSINNLEHDYDIFAFDSNFECIESSVTNGTESESILLSNAFGRYYFVVDSEDCGINSDFSILVGCDCGLTISINAQDDNICENDATTITTVASTGRSPFTFTWSDMTTETNSNGSSTIDAGTGMHCVTVTDGFNCSGVRCVTIGNDGTPFINQFEVTPASCMENNGIIEVDVTGDFALDDTIRYSLDSITFQTDNVFTGLSAGPYTVYVTNTNGCSNLDETIVEEVPAPSISNIETTLDTCRAGLGSLTIIASSLNGGLQYSIDGETFQSSNTFDNLSANVYTASIIDNSNCILSQSVDIMSSPAPQIDTVTIAADTCGINSGQIEIEISGGEGTVMYSIDNEFFQPDPTFSFLAGGTYDIYVIDDNNCLVTSQVLIPTLGAPEVTEMVRDTGACAGNSAAFSVEATLEGEGMIIYQWQILNNDTWSNINNPNIYSGEQTSMLFINDVTGLDASQFRVALSSEFCTQAIVSNTATLRVDGALFLPQGPVDQVLCSGLGTTFTALATSESAQPILYQWELSTNSGLDWSNLPNAGLYSGSNTDSLQISNASNLNNFMYRVTIFTDFCESITSEPALLQIERPMSITAQPNNFNVCSGENVSFSFTINSNGFDNPQFQWQTSANGGANWSNIMDDELYAGTTTTTLNISNVEGLDDYLYRSTVIGNACDTLFTNPALLRVSGQIAISTQPIDVTTCIGQTASFSFSTGNNDMDNSLDVQWEASTDNGQNYSALVDSSLYNGTTTNILNINNVNNLNNVRYRAILLSDNCEPTISEIAILRVESPVAIDFQPSNTVICAGESASFSIQANNDGASEINYIWQINTDGENWMSLSNDNVFNGVQTPNLSISNTFGLNDAQFRALVGNEVCPITTSETATLVTQGPINFSNQPQNIATCDDGNSVSFSAMIVNQGAGDIVYQWEMSDASTGFNTLSDNEIFSGTTETTLSISDISNLNNKRFRLRASTALCPSVFSNPATLVIEGPISIVNQAQDVMSCPGEAVTFNIEASAGMGGTLAYQWQINSSDGWSNLQNNTIYNGVSTNTLSIANTNNLNDSQFRINIVTQLCAVALTSETANLMVQGEVNIAQHPQDNVLCSGESTSFSSVANITGETSVAYQWQISTNNGTDWMDLSNQSPYSDVQTSTLNISSVNGLNNYQYRTKISSEFCDELFTNPATLTVEGPIGITNQPLNVIACSGEGAQFQIDASNSGAGNLSYQWSISTDNGNNYFELTDANFNYNGTTSPSLNILNTANLDSALFHVEISSPNCPIIMSQSASLSVEGPISLMTQPVDQAVCNDGGSVIFSAMVANENSGTISYQWEASNDGMTFTAIEDNSNYSGVQSPTLTIQNADTLNGFQYRLVAQTPACSVLISDIASLAVDAPIIQNIEILEDTCGLNNGSISIMANGGFGNLLYSLNGDNYQTSNSFSNLSSMGYTVFVQDENNCTTSEAAVVPSFGAPNIMDIQIVPDTCGRNIGSLTIIATGNTNDLLYSINGTDFQAPNTFSNLSADSYTIFVKDGFDCAAQMTATITEAGGMLALDLSLEENSGANPNDGIICTAEDVTLTAIASGGNNDYTYTWNNNLENGNIQEINPLDNATYVVTATDENLCFAIDSISISVQESPIASTNSNSPVCEGEAIIFSAAGGSVYEWTGPNGFSSNLPNPTIPVSAGQDAGTYTLTINNQNNCPNSASLEVDVIGPSNYPATVSVIDDFICEGDDNEVVQLIGNLYPTIDARGIWFTNSTGVDIEGVVSAEATASGLNYGANTFIWALSNETCDEFATDSVTVFLEPLPIAKNDSLSSFENVPIDSFSVISNDNIDQLVEWEIDLVKQPENAEVTYLGDGAFSIKAAETFFGELRFSYRLSSLSCNRFVEAEVIVTIKDNTEAVHCVWTPQVDGPTWEICRAISPDNTLRIIDRYGKLVYAASPYVQDWDGTNIETGEPVPTGTYYFVLTQNKNTEMDDEIVGTVVVLR